MASRAPPGRGGAHDVTRITSFGIRQLIAVFKEAKPRTTGLYHVAVRFPDRQSLAQAVRRVLDAGIGLEGASDHGVSEAIYLRDPDENGVELYRDRPREEWPMTPDGTQVAMFTRPLDLRALLDEA